MRVRPSSSWEPMTVPRRWLIVEMTEPAKSEGPSTFDAHDRLEDARFGFREGLAPGASCGLLKCDIRGVDRVVRTVLQRDLDAHDRETRAGRPFVIIERKPFSTEGMNCRGTLPPTTGLFEGRSRRRRSAASCPRSCRTDRNHPSASCGCSRTSLRWVIVSRYATCGGDTSTRQLYSRFMRSM